MVPEIHLAAQTLLFFRSMLLGACLMLLYDVLRIVRMAAPSPAWVVFVEDVAFCAVCAVATFAFLVSANFGEVRAFTLLGEALGALLCGMTVSRVLMACSRAIIAFVRRVLRFVWTVVWKLILRPVYVVARWLAGGIVGFAHFCGIRVKKSLHQANYGLKLRRILLYNLIKSDPQEPARGRRTKKASRGCEMDEDKDRAQEAGDPPAQTVAQHAVPPRGGRFRRLRRG